jgi:hypothetical protein
MTEKVCAATIWGPNAFHSWACGRKAKVERVVDGAKHWFCGTHDPERLADRRKRYKAAFDAEDLQRHIIDDAKEKIEELGRKIPEIEAQYAIIDAARERLHDAIKERRKVR